MEKAVAIAAVGAKASIPVPAEVKASLPAVTRASSPEAAAGAEGGGHSKVPIDFDPYKEHIYIMPQDPYDTNIHDVEPEVDSDDVDSEDESFHKKARHVLRRLQSGSLDRYYCVGGVYMCPFCDRHIDKDFNNVVRHAESLGSDHAKVGRTVNVYAFRAKHLAFGLHLRHLCNLAIHRGEVAPPKPEHPKNKGLGSKKERKHQREEQARRRA